MPHTPQVGMYQQERQVTDPGTDLNADVIDVAGVNRLAVDAAVTLPATASVAINDAGAGTTEVSVKADGVARTDGSLLVGGEDPSGDQQALAVDTGGRAQVTDVNGALLGSDTLANTEATVEVAGVDIFASDASVARDGLIDIEFTGSATGVLSLKLIRAATTVVADLNDGDTIAADTWQAFTFPVRAGDAINLRVDTGMTVTALINFRDR